MKLELRQIARWCSAEFDGAEVEGQSATGYSIDSRTVGPGELFFAVKGERLDGHDFVDAALKRGALAAVVSQDQVSRYTHKNRLLAVHVTLVGLQTLATAVRRVWGKPLVGITGSAGKTTRKKPSRTCWLPAFAS